MPEEIAALAQMRLAQLHAEAGRFSRAYALAADFAARHPHFAQQYEIDYVLGRCLAARAEFQAARQAYGRVIHAPAAEKTRAAAKAQLMIAETYFHQKRYDEAFREYLRVEILYDDPPLQAAAVLQAAKCRQQTGNPEDAARLYHRLLERYPHSPFTKQARLQLQSIAKSP